MTASVRAAQTSVEVVRVRARGLAALACVAAAACQDLPPYVWLVDDPQARRQILPDYFHLVLWHGNRYGEVHSTTDSAGVAVWLPATRDSLPTLTENRARLVEATGAWAKRFLLRQALLDSINPTPGCAQLVLLAVDPACRHQGVGTALLNYQHQRLDQAGVSVFTRAETHEHDWYRRHGYTDTQVVCGPVTTRHPCARCTAAHTPTGSPTRYRHRWPTRQPEQKRTDQWTIHCGAIPSAAPLISRAACTRPTK